MTTNVKQRKIDNRDARCIIFTGMNGTGKSSVARELLEEVADRALVLTFSGSSKAWQDLPYIDVSDKTALASFKGIVQTAYLQHEEDVFEYIFNYYKGGWIVMDDCRDYVDGYIRANKWFGRLMTHFRHHMLDMMFIAHSATEVPPRLWSYRFTYFIGATEQIPTRAELKIDSRDRIINIQKEVNQRFYEAEHRRDGSHYGIFEMLVRGRE